MPIDTLQFARSEQAAIAITGISAYTAGFEIGPLEFICEWPMYGIAETRVGIDAQLVLDAAQRSVRLWPDDDG